MINGILKQFGWLLLKTPPSAKMMREHANTSESFHPSRGGATVKWMRYVAEEMDQW